VNKNEVYKPNKFKAKHMAGFKFNKSTDNLQDCIFANTNMVVNGIRRTPICKHSNSCNTLYHRACALISPDALIRSLNQSSCFSTAFATVRKRLVHAESPAKVLLQIGGTLDEVILHDLGVALGSIPVYVCAAKL
jgi:hypothetical protein